MPFHLWPILILISFESLIFLLQTFERGYIVRVISFVLGVMVTTSSTVARPGGCRFQKDLVRIALAKLEAAIGIGAKLGPRQEVHAPVS